MADLEARMADGIHVFLLGPRRYGKSSIVEQAISGFRSSGGRVGYADLIRCTTEAEVATETLRAVVNGVLRAPNAPKNSWRTSSAACGSPPPCPLTPTVRSPSASIRRWAPAPGSRSSTTRSAFSTRPAITGPSLWPSTNSERVAEVGSKGMGGAFKAAADRLTHASLILSGSHLTVMERLTRTRGAPLYGMGELVVIDVIDEGEMVPYLQRRARAGGKRLTKSTAAHLYTQAGGVPNDVQWLAYSAFEAAGDADEIDNGAVDAGMEAVVGRQASNFAERFETLAPSQQRVLKALADAPTARVFTKAFMDRVQVANANAVRKALEVLSELELVQRRSGVYELGSPFLRAWLLRGSEM